METDTYDECGIKTDVEVNQTMDNRKSGDSKDEQESGKTYIVLTDVLKKYLEFDIDLISQKSIS